MEGLDDEMQVLIPLNQEFDGQWYSPCVAESGTSEMGLEDLDEEELKERELLNKEVKKETSFVLVPHGFSDEKDHTHELN
jgi:hypothetical protein